MTEEIKSTLSNISDKLSGRVPYMVVMGGVTIGSVWLMLYYFERIIIKILDTVKGMGCVVG